MAPRPIARGPERTAQSMTSRAERPTTVDPDDRLHLPLTPAPGRARIERSIAVARDWLFGSQKAPGYWCEQLEGDTSVESYWIMVHVAMGRGENERVLRLAGAIRQRMLPDGGWSRYPGGPADISVSCLSYLALKLAGVSADDADMRRSRNTIVTMGGAECANSYTKYYFALFGQCSWDAVPAIPPEMVLLPAAGPFSIYDMSSWSRTIFVPLSIVFAHRPVCEVPPERGAQELLALEPPSGVMVRPGRGLRRLLAVARLPRTEQWRQFFIQIDRMLKRYERWAPRWPLRRWAIERAADWMVERLRGSEGLSAILPAMAQSIMALRSLGYDGEHVLVREQLAHLDALLLEDEAGALRMQPCISPVWDTLQSCHALLHAGAPPEHPSLQRAATWLLQKQCRVPGDWARKTPAEPGGWYFENANELYPDVDDTCMALMVLRRVGGADSAAAREVAIQRGLAWMLAMQNRDGGWASFDRDNDKDWLAFVPFADHNAMIDPSTADITGRVLECLSHFPGYGVEHPVCQRALRFLRASQESDGCWYGRWGVNYIYGTWQVLRGLSAIGEDMDQPYVRRAVRWLLSHQNADGGWGESIESYDEPSQRGQGASTPSQTAWALMGLIAAHQAEHPSVRHGVRYLLDRQDARGTWAQELWTGTGFPRVFYLNYHGYRHYFPLMALGEYHAARFSRGSVSSIDDRADMNRRDAKAPQGSS
jgi:squalene-hopene/tetraprenyl-beta-curcumene cyclase